MRRLGLRRTVQAGCGVTMEWNERRSVGRPKSGPSQPFVSASYPPPALLLVPARRSGPRLGQHAYARRVRREEGFASLGSAGQSKALSSSGPSRSRCQQPRRRSQGPPPHRAKESGIKCGLGLGRSLPSDGAAACLSCSFFGTAATTGNGPPPVDGLACYFEESAAAPDRHMRRRSQLTPTPTPPVDQPVIL